MTIPVEQPGEHGAVLIAVLVILMMLSALSAALLINGRTGALIAYNERAGAQAGAAAEAALNHAVELVTTFIAERNANGFANAEARLTRCSRVRTGTRAPSPTTAAWARAPASRQPSRLPLVPS